MKPERQAPPQGGERDIPGARMTWRGLLLCLLYLGLPVLVIGNLADIAFQLLFGRCVGLWCVF